ncbi:MAG: isoleucine--tRNA ligase [Phycisphaerales bacterium]
MGQATGETSQNSGGSREKNRFKDTLNLPRTGFPMRAGLVQNEPKSIERWNKMDLYQKLRQRPHPNGRWVFHDGPPYANGSIHLGHMLNKSLKDFVVRSRSMMGFDVPYVPGWDTHGLPIEHKVMTTLEEKGKLAKIADLPDDKRRMVIRRECESHARKYHATMTEEMQRLLTLADYEHPYLTLQPEYEGATLEVFATLVERGLVYRQLKAVHWSAANQTALADAELEYEDREDISVFVDFEAADPAGVYSAFGLRQATEDDEDDSDEEGDEAPDGLAPDQRPCFMIWTTTPWTLPANLAIAVNPKFTYALAKVDGNYTILAEDLVEKVTKAGKAESVQIIARTSGEQLLGLRYRHPFVQGGPDFTTQPDAAMRGAEPANIYQIVAADYVTLEDGTGLVHTAPGHGSEDYLTGLREKLPIYCPVRADGTYDDSVPDTLRGRNIWEANPAIVETLRDSGHLFHDNKFMHSYPHDWRSKTPVIFRATEQWFIGVDEKFGVDGDHAHSLRERAFLATEAGSTDSVKFVPEWGRNRMRGMLESRPDWCISRQRSWGLPIPAFYTPEGECLLTPASVRAIAKAFREEGSDSWFEKDAAHLLRHYNPANDTALPTALRSLDKATLTKGYDIFDVWFEAGSSWNAVLRERSSGQDFPSELYLEGSDQHRGWFQLSLLPSLGVMGAPPYRTLLTHGFCVDKNGHKMSKSLGNTINVADLMREFGADVARWWVAGTPYEGDIKTDPSFFKTAGESYFKIRNTLRFLLGNTGDFDPKRDRSPKSAFTPESIDTWALAQLDELTAAVTAGYEKYQFQRVAKAIFDFCNDTMSAVYLSAVKDRLYCDRPDAPRRRRTQTALFEIADQLCRLMAPILPHTADEAFCSLHQDHERCVHLELFNRPIGITPDPRWKGIMAARDAGLLALESVRKDTDLDNPLDAQVTLGDPDGVLSAIDPADLADLMGVSRAVRDQKAPFGTATVQDLRDQPRCERSWKRDGTVKQRTDGAMLSARDAAAMDMR